MVEPPGIAPGSSPLMTCAFILIVRRTGRLTYRTSGLDLKNRCEIRGIDRPRSATSARLFADRHQSFVVELALACPER